ncbi:hypothetical protein EV127DRAFT_409411 [Xylaria flabelliformis]|nr:hypothetical protein EV127DRAFT_409411 [Xylaria flabelliformis]
MYDPLTVAYVAFSLSLVIGLIAMWFTYRLFILRPHLSLRIYNYDLKVYHYITALSLLSSYFVVAIVLLALTAIHGSQWAEWSWRWSVGAALLDSICTMNSTREWSKFTRVVHFQIAIASMEIVLIVILPAIPNPVIRIYLNLGVIVFHSMWTALSTWFWTCGRRRVFRWVASVGQGIGAVASIWSPLAFVIIFYTFSIIICTEELNESPQHRWRISSNRERVDREVELQQIYNVIFFGKCIQRTESIRKVVRCSFPCMQVGGIDIFYHPTLKGVKLASIPPDVSLGVMDKDTYIRAFIRSAAAVVLVLDLFNGDSWDYIETLRGFSEGQPILLVAFNYSRDDWQTMASIANEYANERGWDFTIDHDMESAFLKLMRKMHTRPPSLAHISGTSRSRFEL